MSESNVPEIIKYLTEDSLKLMYSRLNRRYLVVDALPSADSLEPADKNVIYVVKETVGKTVRYWPNVLDNDVWKPFGIGQADLDGKVDKVDAAEGHLVVADKDGNLVDADIMPGTLVALAIDPSESIQPHATDLRKIWKAYQSGMPVTLLDNRPDGSGLYAQLNAAGYTWVDGNRMTEYLDGVDDDNRQCDGTIHGYCVERDGVVKFYEDDEHTVEIIPENGKLYCDDTVPDHDRVYLYNDGFVRALRFVQFSCNELIDDDPAWPSRRATRQVFYRMTEPYGSSSPDGFEVAYGESTADIHAQMVTGARIGDGKLLPVDDGVIVLPKSTAVNDGTLTITVGESEPVVFSANDSADRGVDIPVATDEVAGLVRITSDVDSDDPDAAITATAVLNELDSYVQKVDGATAGHIAVFTSEGSMSDSGISSTDVESAIGHDHTHANKSILDEVTAPYTPDEQAKLSGIEVGAQINVIETVKVNGTALPVTNKAVDIDMPDKADKVPGATSGNFAALDASGNLADSGSKSADFATAEQGALADTALQAADIEGKANKAEMIIETVQGDETKKTIQLKDGLSQDVVIAHQDISGKADKNEMSVTAVPGDDTKKTIQLYNGLSQEVLVAHQDISGKVDAVEGKELSSNDYTDADAEKLANLPADAEANVIVGVSVDGSALTPDANRTVDIPMASYTTANGNDQTVYVTGVVTGQDKQKWDSWTAANVDVPPADGIRIGGKKYPYRQFGNTIWMTENLKYDIDDASNLTIRDGQYYYRARYLFGEEFAKIIPPGWRVPSIADRNSFHAIVSQSTNIIEYLTQNFNLENCAFYNGYNPWPGDFASGWSFCAGTYGNGPCGGIVITQNGYANSNNLGGNDLEISMCIRLCKDAT